MVNTWNDLSETALTQYFENLISVSEMVMDYNIIVSFFIIELFHEFLFKEAFH